MLVINYPEPSFRLKKEGDKDFLFDPLRKKWILLTPEEWVRQNFINYLISEIQYPATLIAVEKEIKLGEMKKRFDILVYDRAHQPWMMVECKAMDIPLNDTVMQQVLRYNLSTPVRYIIISNGQYSFGWERGQDGLTQLTELPPMP